MLGSLSKGHKLRSQVTGDNSYYSPPEETGARNQPKEA